MERLQKIIAEYGYASRRKAEELIKQGKVYVNGVKVTELGTLAKATDIIEINGEVLKEKAKYEYYLLNKPRGVISSVKDEKGRTTVTDLIKESGRIYPVGRLDYDTTGIILLTNDGELTNILSHPKNEVPKTYLAKVKGHFKVLDLQKLRHGLYIDNYKTSKCHAKIKEYDKKTNTTKVELTIHEGKNHEVKKMFEALGYQVVKLKRLTYANLTLSKVPSGKYRKLTLKEVKILYNYAKKDKEN